MIDNCPVFAFIPARGGSKGLPGKNIKNFCGKPLVAWSIAAASSCSYVDKVIVSTNDEEIAGIARSWGANVPYLRSEELSSDSARSIDVVIDMIHREVKEESYIVLLQPTSPLRTAEDIENAFKYMLSKRSKSLVSFVKCKSNPYWMVTKEPGSTYARLMKSGKKFQRQLLPELYEYNGAIYINTSTNLLKERSFENSKTVLYAMPQHKSIDIDDSFDWFIAEQIYTMNYKGSE